MKNSKLKLILAILIPILSQSQTWQWAKNAGTVGRAFGPLVCTDQVGNHYAVVYAEGSLCYFQTDTLAINGINDEFIVKYDVNGNEIWIKQIGGPNINTMNRTTEGISDLIYDSVANCIYATGQFYETSNFGGITLNTFTDDLSIFLTKIDLNGNFLWAQKSLTNGEDGAGKLATDTIGNIYMVGQSVNPIKFNTLIAAEGGFMAKFDAAGNIKWLKNISGGNFIGNARYQPRNIIISNSDLYLYGPSKDSVTLDTISFSGHNYKSILSAWDTSGHIHWAKQFAEPFLIIPGQFSRDASGNLYCIGSFNGPYAVFDTDTLFNNNPWGGYISKYDNTGQFIWTKPIQASQLIYCFSSSCDGDGNVYVTGGFSGNALFQTNGTPFNVTASTSQDIFVARFNTNGECLGVRNVGQGIGYDIISNSDGGATVTGYFENTSNFGTNTITSHGSEDMFIAKIGVITGTEENGGRLIKNQLIIYANPNQGKCTIKIPDEFANETNLSLSIFDNSGKLIQQKTVTMSDGKIKLNLEAEAKGIYNVILSSKTKSYNGKIVFE